jgi:KDO2-lipid IV(A) lauroyltransferase
MHDRSPSPSWRRAVKNELIYGAATLALRGIGLLPSRWLEPLGRLTGSAAHLLFVRARRIARHNVALVHPRLSPLQRDRLVRTVFRTLGMNLTDTLALLRPREPASRTLEIGAASQSALETALAGGRGVIYVTGHLGPWERMAALLADRGFPITTLARESYDQRFHAMVYDRVRTDRNVHAIYRGRVGAPYAIVRALSRGRVVGFPIDLPGRIPVLPVTFLGQPSHLPVGPARIALRTRSPLVVGTPAPGAGARLEIRIAPLPYDDLPATPEGEAQLTQRIADALSERILALPEHWPWMHPSFGPIRAASIADPPEEPIHSAPGENLV